MGAYRVNKLCAMLSIGCLVVLGMTPSAHHRGLTNRTVVTPTEHRHPQDRQPFTESQFVTGVSADQVFYSQPYQRLFVVGALDNQSTLGYAVIDTLHGRVLVKGNPNAPIGAGTSALAGIDPNRGRGFVLPEGTNQQLLWVIDLRTGHVAHRWQLPVSVGILTPRIVVDPTTGNLFLYTDGGYEQHGGGYFVMMTQNGHILRNILVPYEARDALLDGRGHRVVLVDRGTIGVENVTVVDARADRVMWMQRFDPPLADIRVDAGDGTMWTVTYLGSVVIRSLATGHVVRVIPAGSNPAGDRILLDEGRHTGVVYCSTGACGLEWVDAHGSRGVLRTAPEGGIMSDLVNRVVPLAAFKRTLLIIDGTGTMTVLSDRGALLAAQGGSQDLGGIASGLYSYVVFANGGITTLIVPRPMPNQVTGGYDSGLIVASIRNLASPQ